MRGTLGMLMTSIISICVGTASAQYSSGFETTDGIEALPAGAELNGQDLFYNPLPNDSISAQAFVYAENVHGVASNPNGSEQFVMGINPGGGLDARSQRDVEFGDGTGEWTIGFDAAALYLGDGVPLVNLGSVSTAFPDGNPGVIALARWTNGAAETWRVAMVWFNAAGNQLTELILEPGFSDLEPNHWYRWTIAIDFTTNRVTAVTLVDLSTGETSTFEPVDRFMLGGDAPAIVPPSVRLYAGNSLGNSLAIDNFDIASVAADCAADVNGDGELNVLDFVAFQLLWQDGDLAADCDANGAFNILDFVCFQQLFVQGCE